MRKALLSLTVVAAMVAAAPAANAATGTGLVTGTVLGTITVAATGGSFGTNLAPGATVNSLLADNVIVTNTNGGWTLQAGDASATTPGYMDATPACPGSEASLQSPLHLKAGTATSIAGGTFSLGTGAADFALPANTSPFTVGSLAGTTGLGGTATVPITYSQSIAANEQVAAGCVYTLTTTYTATGS